MGVAQEGRRSKILTRFGCEEKLVGVGVDPTWIVALQAVGGAAGNTICVHNVVAASAMVGMLGKEGLVIRRTLPAFIYYAGVAGCLGYAIVWFGTQGWLNMGTVLLGLIVFGIAWFIRRHLSLVPKP